MKIISLIIITILLILSPTFFLVFRFHFIILIFLDYYPIQSKIKSNNLHFIIMPITLEYRFFQ